MRSSEGQFLGAVDLNDTSKHVISNMDDLDVSLGIVKPHEMAMMRDPRQAGQLDRKRNWNNRSNILNSIYQSQFSRPEPESDDQRTRELFAKQEKGQQLDLEQEGQYRAGFGRERVGHGDRQSERASDRAARLTKRGIKAFDSDRMSAYKAPRRLPEGDTRPIVGETVGGPGTRYTYEGVRYPEDQRPVGFVPPARRDGYPSAPPETPYRSREQNLEEEGAFDREAFRSETFSNEERARILEDIERRKDRTPKPETQIIPYTSSIKEISDRRAQGNTFVIDPDDSDNITVERTTAPIRVDRKKDERSIAELEEYYGQDFVDVNEIDPKKFEKPVDIGKWQTYQRLINSVYDGKIPEKDFEEFRISPPNYRRAIIKSLEEVERRKDNENMQARENTFVTDPDDSDNITVERLSDPGVNLDLEGGVKALGDTPTFIPDEKEKNLLDYHRDNLFNNKFLENKDGTITTLYSMTFEAEDGRIYIIPGYDSESRKTLSFNDALKRAKKIGLDNFPSYENRDKARQAEVDLHKIIDLDMRKFERNAKRDMQAGGEVPQINKSGLIQGEGGPTSDSIPMRAEPNSFIINAPAVEMAGGKKKIDSMVNKVQKQQSVSGFNQFGNPVTGAQDINVSNGEYKVSKKDAQKIGYDTLDNINDAGKPFVEQLDSRGYAEGDQVPKPIQKPLFAPQELINAVIYTESGGQSHAKSDKGAIGLMQIMPKTAADPGYDITPLEGTKTEIEDQLYDVEINKAFGTEYLNMLFNRYGGDIERSMIGFNAGPTRADKYKSAKEIKAAIKSGKLNPKTKSGKWTKETLQYIEKINNYMKNPKKFPTAIKPSPRKPSVGFVEESTASEPVPEYLSNRGFVEEPILEEPISEKTSPRISIAPTTQDLRAAEQNF